MPPGMSQAQFNEMLKKSPPFTDLQKQVGELGVAVKELSDTVAGMATALQELIQIVQRMDQRLKALEDAHQPEQPPEQPQPPLADCTSVQLPSPPYTIEATAADAGPDATYAWKGGGTDSQGQPMVGTGQIVRFTYPHAGSRTIELTVTRAGLSSTHLHPVEVAENGGGTTPPPDGGGETEPPPTLPGEWQIDETFEKYATRDDLIGTPPDVRAIPAGTPERRQAEIAADNAGRFLPVGPFVHFSQDEIWRHTLETRRGRKVMVQNYDFAGNPCMSAHCTRNILYPQPFPQRVLVLFDYELDENWGGLVQGCPPPSDDKTLFLGTAGPESGRVAYHVGQNGSLDPSGDPFGQVVMLNSLSDQMQDQYVLNIRPLAVKDIIGKRVQALIDFQHSTRVDSSDAHVFVHHSIEGGAFALAHRITGFNTWQDPARTIPDRHDSLSTSHNKDKGRNGLNKRYIGRIAVMWKNLPPPGQLPSGLR